MKAAADRLKPYTAITDTILDLLPRSLSQGTCLISDHAELDDIGVPSLLDHPGPCTGQGTDVF